MSEKDYQDGLDGKGEPWTFLGTTDEDMRDWEAGRRQRLINQDLAKRIRDDEEEPSSTRSPGPQLSYQADKLLGNIVLAGMMGLMAAVPTFVLVVVVVLILGLPLFRISCSLLFLPSILVGGITAAIQFDKLSKQY